MIHFLQLPQQGLPVEQIPGYKKKIRLLLLTYMNHMFKSIPQLLLSVFTVQRTRIRLRAQMYIRDMDKSHVPPPAWPPV